MVWVKKLLGDAQKLSLYALAIGIFAALGSPTSSYANHDYVCSYYTSACNCTWDTNWRADGTKHCVGSKKAITRYGNTRVGCPSGGYAYGDAHGIINGRYATINELGINGSFGWGDVLSGTPSCELVAYDTLAPQIDSVGDPLMGNGTIKAYKKADCTGTQCYFSPNDCTGAGASLRCQGELHSLTSLGVSAYNTTKSASEGLLSYLVSSANAAAPEEAPKAAPECSGSDCIAKADIVVVGYRYQASCRDNRAIWNVATNEFGDSGCNMTTPNVIDIKKGERYTFAAKDLAGNTANCTVDGTTGVKQCSITKPARPTVVDTVSCTYAGGGRCIPDSTPPTAQIEYTPTQCTNTNVVVTNRCVSDNASGCRGGTEGAPQISVGASMVYPDTLGVADVAGNIANLSYFVNWIDKVAPSGVDLAVSPQTAGINIATITGYDEGTAGCTRKSLAYNIHIAGAENRDVSGYFPATGVPYAVNLGIQKIGNYTFTLTVKDEAGNTVVAGTESATIFPARPDESRSTLTLLTPKDAQYANGAQEYAYKVILRDQYDNPIYSKPINSIGQAQDGTVKTIKADMTNPASPTGAVAVLAKYATATPTATDGSIQYTLYANAPGVFGEKFKFSMMGWGNDYQPNGQLISLYLSTGQENSFRKPFMGAFKIDGLEHNQLLLGTNMPFKIGVTEKAAGAYNGRAIENFASHIKLTQSAHQIIQTLSSITDLTSSPVFSLRINAKDDEGTTMAPGIRLNPHAVMGYQLNGQTIRYNLTKGDAGGDTQPLEFIETKAFQGLKVVGAIQGTGKQTVTGQAANASDLSKNELRRTIRQNSVKITAGLAADTVSKNGVMYHNGDYTLSAIPAGVQTLIVKNGNLLINTNITPTSKFGVIVLGSNGKGNVYVTPNVIAFNGLIYADGSFVSANDSGSPYTGDSTERTRALQKQLVVKGSLYTVNTIGGAILGTSGHYIVPGGKTTDDFDTAMYYDLNYIRRGASGCDKNGNGICTDAGEFKDPFVISYNPALITNPPVGFGAN